MILISLGQVVVVVVMFLIFFYLAPWLSVKPISELEEKYRNNLEIPIEAKSFSINHGEVVFHSHGTIQQEPVYFGVLVFLLFSLLLLLFVGEYIKVKS